ncbi:hypothetical protein GJAV_G00091410 [Gymnothorax javanicus]|nr:hypothetical protein GJAV_G00091410 [Gymnothorax javanicus]
MYVCFFLCQADCISLSGNLASEHSEEDHKFLKALQRRNDQRVMPFWIGLSHRHQEGTWMWTDGSPVDYEKWIPGQPDNLDNNEHCVHSDYGYLRNWNDVTRHGVRLLMEICFRSTSKRVISVSRHYKSTMIIETLNSGLGFQTSTRYK